MKRIILLNESFPNEFKSVNIELELEYEKINYIENQIINSVNNYNSKLNVEHIEYLDISKQFPSFKIGKSNGLLIEEFTINPKNKDTYLRNGCYIYSIENDLDKKYICRRILMYLFISNTSEKSRTSFISQTIFPTLLDYAEDYLDSPSYSLANHKFCFINIVNKKITSQMILRHIVSLYLSGMDYIEVFDNNSFIKNNLPKNLKQFFNNYYSDYNSNYNLDADIYENDFCKIDFYNKVFIWKTNTMISKLIIKNNGKMDFKGSEEKFYWMELLPISIFAYKQGYRIDFSEYSDFIEKYKEFFSEESKKFLRCNTLLKYIEKYFT